MRDARVIKEEVKKQEDNEIGTVWGLCTVIRLGKDDAGKDIILLSEGTEEFFVPLADWDTLRV